MRFGDSCARRALREGVLRWLLRKREDRQLWLSLRNDLSWVADRSYSDRTRLKEDAAMVIGGSTVELHVGHRSMLLPCGLEAGYLFLLARFGRTRTG